MLLEPLATRLVIGEFPDHDAVDSGAILSDSFDLVLGHLSNPQYTLSLQSRMSQIDRTVGERLGEIAATYEHERNHIVRELQQ